MNKADIIVKAAQNRLISFCEIINPVWQTDWFHEHIANTLQNALERIRRGEKVRIILAIPPRHGKTQLSSIYFPAWALGKYPDMKFILSTYGMNLSEDNGRKTRDVISSDVYQSIFPHVKLRGDQKAKAKWVVTGGTENVEGSYTAVGIGTAVTGSGAQCILLDDPHKDRQEAESDTISDMVWEYYRSTLYSRLEGHGGVIIIMQRWNQKDLVARVLEESEKNKKAGEPYDEWEVIQFPAIAEKDEYINNVLVRKEGDPLWKSKFPLDVLHNIKSTQGTYHFASQYMQTPINRETQEFHEETFRYFDEEDLAGKYLRYYTLVDPAISQKKDADNTVVVTVAKEVNGPNIYRIREDAGHFTPAQTVDLIFVHQSQYLSEVHIETVQYQQALKYAVIEEQRKRGQYFVVKELKAKGDKKLRIRGLVPMYQAGVIWHRHADQAYESELLSFPNGKHDDRIDAMAYIQYAMDNTQTGITQARSKFKGYFNRWR